MGHGFLETERSPPLAAKSEEVGSENEKETDYPEQLEKKELNPELAMPTRQPDPQRFSPKYQTPRPEDMPTAEDQKALERMHLHLMSHLALQRIKKMHLFDNFTMNYLAEFYPYVLITANDNYTLPPFNIQFGYMLWLVLMKFAVFLLVSRVNKMLPPILSLVFLYKYKTVIDFMVIATWIVYRLILVFCGKKDKKTGQGTMMTGDELAKLIRTMQPAQRTTLKEYMPIIDLVLMISDIVAFAYVGTREFQGLVIVFVFMMLMSSKLIR